MMAIPGMTSSPESALTRNPIDRSSNWSSVPCSQLRVPPTASASDPAITRHAALTDNGAIYTARYRKGTTAFETELATLSVVHKHAAPYHPQTCGKVERFHQTLKKFLNAQPDADTITALQADIDRFVTHYNHHRPHRSIGRRTTAQAYNARIKATPAPATTSHYRTRHDTVDNHGRVTLRYRGRLHHIGIGRPHAGTAITLLTHDRDIRIINRHTGELLRHLTLDPNRDYQPQNAKGD